jgi:hypothetical protein
MERETVTYNGKNYHRYPESKRAQLRNYFYRHDKNNESPVALHRQMWEDKHGPIPEGKEIHHKNKVFTDNYIENFECLSSPEHRQKHPPSEETRQKFRENAKKRDPLSKWREENPELAKKYAKENGGKSEGLANWRKNNPELVNAVAKESGRKSAEARAKKGIVSTSLNDWRKNNPELAKQIYRDNGLKNNSLDEWRKNNPELAKESLNTWRKNNPELAKQAAQAAAKKSVEARAKKRASLQFNGG